MVYKREMALDLRPYKPFLSTPLPKDKKNFLPGDQLLPSDSQFNERQQ